LSYSVCYMLEIKQQHSICAKTIEIKCIHWHTYLLGFLHIIINLFLKANYYKILDLKNTIVCPSYFSILTTSHIGILIVRANTGPRVDQTLS